MKTSTIWLTALAAIAAAGVAQAQTKIYITGSSAFRSAAVPAISAALGLPGPTAYDGSDPLAANANTWTGGTVSGQPVTVKTSWSGSGAGIQTVAGSFSNVRFLPDGLNGSGQTDPRNPANPSAPHEDATPDIAFSDIYQSSTPFNRTFLGVNYNGLTDQLVGVVTFKFVASNGFPGNNITDTQAQQLFSGGFAPLALFTAGATGNGATRAGDQLKVVYATGRNPDSGTRVTALADVGLGAQATVKQYKPVINGTTITALALYGVETINGVSTTAPGNSGESSGSTLRNYMNKTLTAAAYQTEDGAANGGYILTYLGVSDATRILPGGSDAGTTAAVELNYNGVTFSPNAVIQGQYGFWGYEHLMYRNTASGVQKTLGDNIVTRLLATPTTGGTVNLNPNVNLNEMAVSRGGDGTPIGSNYL